MGINGTPSQSPHLLSLSVGRPQGILIPTKYITHWNWGILGDSPGRCHLTHCDSVVAQEALHTAGTVLDKQGPAQVLEGEGLGWVKAVVGFCNKDPS